MNPTLKGAVYMLGFVILSETFYKLFYFVKEFSEKKPNKNCISSKNSSTSEVMKVYFFPDSKIACKTHFLSDSPCFKNCKFSHDITSLSEIYIHMNSCRETMDVCVFVMTCADLVGIILTMHKRGVKVRVITDDEQENISGSQVWSLREAGINLRTDNSSNFMHHKFVLIDGQMLINGSFNWTQRAITGNQENVIITNHSKVISAFKDEFEKLWHQFDPAKIHNSEIDLKN